MPTWLQLTLGLLTIAASGITSAIVTYTLASKRELLIVKRQKLEQLNESLIGWCNQLGVHWITFQGVMAGKIDYNTALDLSNNRTDQEHHAVSLKLLTLLYFPELEACYNKLELYRDEGAKLLNDHKQAYQQSCGGGSPVHAKGIVDLIQLLDAAENNFQKEITLIAAKLN